ncbi:MAG TPA: carboxypeptidase-like regulatory domain-containing protein, partial [Chitinophagaceae bacterium]
MRNYLLFCFLALTASFSSIAQSKVGKVTGVVIDNGSKPLQSASVSLLRAKDSSLVKVSVSNKDGKYEFENIATGNYLLSVTSVGFTKKHSAAFSITEADPSVNLKPLEMLPAAKQVGEVTVTSKKPFIETKIDKTIVNVDASPTSAGATALEILEKSPGISVDNDGNISLRGKAGVIVMMDGKQTYLSATDLANLLRNTPASA